MRSLAIALCSVGCAVPALCQEPSRASGTAVNAGDHYVERSAGFSWYSPRGSSLGSIKNRRVYVTGVRGEWVFKTAGPVAIASTVELVPLAIIERTVSGETLLCEGQRYDFVARCERDRSARLAAGAGASPLGLKMYLNRDGRTRLYAAGAAGALAFSSDVPVTGSRHFNYTFEYGGGAEVVARGGRTLTVGYKFHHLSNAGTARVNPGLDSNILYIGLRSARAR